MNLRCLVRVHADAALILRAFELHLTVKNGIDGVIVAHTDANAGMKLGSALADDDVAGLHDLAAKFLDAEALRVGIATVTS